MLSCSIPHSLDHSAKLLNAKARGLLSMAGSSQRMAPLLIWDAVLSSNYFMTSISKIIQVGYTWKRVLRTPEEHQANTSEGYTHRFLYTDVSQLLQCWATCFPHSRDVKALHTLVTLLASKPAFFLPPLLNCICFHCVGEASSSCNNTLNISVKQYHFAVQ